MAFRRNIPSPQISRERRKLGICDVLRGRCGLLGAQTNQAGKWPALRRTRFNMKEKLQMFTGFMGCILFPFM